MLHGLPENSSLDADTVGHHPRALVRVEMIALITPVPGRFVC
jgi:hypothetical protein